MSYRVLENENEDGNGWDVKQRDVSDRAAVLGCRGGRSMPALSFGSKRSRLFLVCRTMCPTRSPSQ